jgi:ABC-2 type transport system permease protein
MKHIPAIASRELQSLFVSPVAYGVLTLFALLAGFFFLSSILQFQDYVLRLQQFQAFDQLSEVNLNDHVIYPFFGTMSIILLIVIPAATMGLFATEKSNGTEELLLTSPLTIWELVVGKFLAAGLFVLLLVVVTAFFPGLLFFYGDPDPEMGKTVTGLLGLLLVALLYAAIGAFSSSVTRSQFIAFLLALAIELILLILAFFAEVGAARGALGSDAWAANLMRYLSTSDHLEDLLQGLVSTSSLAYFAAATGGFLLLAKTAVESVRWR